MDMIEETYAAIQFSPAALEIFRRRAEQKPSSNESASGLTQQDLFRELYDKQMFPMSAAYLSPAGGKDPQRDRFLAQKYAEYLTQYPGPTGLEILDMVKLAGEKIFERIITEASYYPNDRDRKIIGNPKNLEKLGKYIPRSSFISFFTGYGDKENHILIDLKKLGYGSPAALYMFDVVKDSLTQAKETIRKNFPELPITIIPVDLFSRGVWKSEVWKKATQPPEQQRLEAPPPQRVAISLGVTIGNFMNDEHHFLFNNQRDVLGPGGIIIHSVDYCKDMEKIKEAYDRALPRLFFLKGFISAVEDVGKFESLDLESLDCEVNFVKGPYDAIDVEFNIVNKSDQTLTDHEGNCIDLPRGKLRVGLVRKMDPELFNQELGKLGIIHQDDLYPEGSDGSDVRWSIYKIGPERKSWSGLGRFGRGRQPQIRKSAA